MKYIKIVSKKICLIFVGIVMSANIFAQAPEKMSYQAVIRNTSDNLITNQAIGMQISILKGGITGTVVYVETQTPISNSNGLVSIEIGTGTIVTGDFSSINWAGDSYFIKTESDPTGGTTYSISGTSQLMSVPYALHAKTAQSIVRDTTVDYIHFDTIGNFEIKSYNGEHNLYEVSSSKEIYNTVTQQTAVVGVTKDNHNPIDPENDTRAFMVHNDNVRDLTKLVVLEPGELTISVLDASTGSTPLATIMMKDNEEEIVIGNSYSGMTNKQNLIRLQKESTTMEFIDLTSGTSRVFEFGENGLRLYSNGNIVWGVNLDGSNYSPVAVGDIVDGGIVVAIDGSGQHGLIIDLFDLSSADWGCDGTIIGASLTDVGEGQQNTTDIVTNCAFGAIAAQVCTSSSNGGNSDWFLPTKDALNLIYSNLATINAALSANSGTVISASSYWSSSEIDGNNAWSLDFSNGTETGSSKVSTFNVRAVRYF